MTTARAFVKRLLSYTKSTWEFQDFPLRTWRTPNAPDMSIAWTAAFDNWVGLVGHGETKKKAIQDLAVHFYVYKSIPAKLVPRPGTKSELKHSPNEKVKKHEDIAVDFFRRVLDANYYRGYYSDVTSLSDLAPPDEDQVPAYRLNIINKTHDIYGVDISDLYDKPLHEVLSLIKNRH